MRIGYRSNPAQKLCEHLVSVTLRGGQEIGDINFGFGVQLQAVNSELRLVLEQLHHASDLQETITLKGGHHLGDVVPHLGVQVTGAIRKRERKIWLTSL